MRTEEHERAPCGVPGGLEFVNWQRVGGPPDYPRLTDPPSLVDVRALRPRPWTLVMWQPLTDRVPGPHLVRAYCCYINTVIFYAAPYQVLPPRRYLTWLVIDPDTTGRMRQLARPRIVSSTQGEFAQYARIESRLRFDDHVRFEDEVFHVNGGSVAWSRPAWWELRRAVRARPDSRCATCEREAARIFRCLECTELVQWVDDAFKVHRGRCRCGGQLRPAWAGA